MVCSLRAGGCRLLALVALLLCPPAPATAVPPLDETMRSLEATYGRISDLKATFQQAAWNRTANQITDAKGTLYWKKPGKLRWEYTTPTPLEIVSDGRRLWLYTPELKQVNVSEVPDALAGPAGSFLQGLGQVREHFQARYLNPAQPTDPEGRIVLDLAPTQPRPLLARLILALDPASWLVRQAVVYDELGNTVTVRFDEVWVNAGLAESLFVFVPPPGVAVVPSPGLGKP